MLTLNKLDSGTLELEITGPIYPGIFEDFKAVLGEFKPSAVNMTICSEGGSLIDAFALFNVLKGLPNVTATVNGWAASSASVILMAAAEIRMHANSFIMIHEPSLCLYDANLTECRKAAGILETMRDTIASAYAARSNVDTETLKTWMREETWLSATEAQNAGFCNVILDAVEIAAKATIPDNLKEIIMGKKTAPANAAEEKKPCAAEETPAPAPAEETKPAEETQAEETAAPAEETPAPEEPAAEEDGADPIAELQHEAEELKKEVEALQAEVETLKASLEQKDTELTEMKNRAAKAAAGLKISAKSEAKSVSAMTWNDAVKACGGDYVAARRKHPEIFGRMIAENSK